VRSLLRALSSACEKDTLELAARLGGCLRGGDVVALSGVLGSGKTTFTRGLAAGLGLAESRLVSSPTYVLEQVYPARVPLHHYDTYRLRAPEEFLALGFEERIKEGAVLVIEWAEKVAPLLPEETLGVEIIVPPVDRLAERLESGPGTCREIRVCGSPRTWEFRLAAPFPESK